MSDQHYRISNSHLSVDDFSADGAMWSEPEEHRAYESVHVGNSSSTLQVEYRSDFIRRSGTAVLTSFLLGCMVIVTADGYSADPGAFSTSCDTDLTCARATQVATGQKFSSGPDLSKWRLLGEHGQPVLRKTMFPGQPDSLIDPVTGMEFVFVPGGCYRTNLPVAQSGEVCIDPFYIGAYEVTFDEYDRFALATGRDLPDDEGWERGNRPAINVNVYDALNFAKWLSRKTQVHYRLPTEVEWEHAARAGTGTSFPWGDMLGVNRANCDGCGSVWDDERTAPVGSFEPNAWGLYDVVGNVGEWTCSMRDTDPASSFARCDSIFETRRRAYRNGAWSDDPDRLGLAFRDWNVAMRRTDDVGFRLVRECGECKPELFQRPRDTVAQQKTE